MLTERQLLELATFTKAVERLCAAADEAAHLASPLFSQAELKPIRRGFARCMEFVEKDVYPVLKAKYPEAFAGLDSSAH